VILDPRGTDETMMTIEHELLPPEQVDDHGNGWTAIAAQLGDALAAR
jgi:hypothetical protein